MTALNPEKALWLCKMHAKTRSIRTLHVGVHRMFRFCGLFHRLAESLMWIQNMLVSGPFMILQLSCTT